MVALRSILALCSLFIFVQSAVVTPRPSDCSTTTLHGVLVTGQVTHPLYFCTWYLEDIRTRSPLLGLSPEALTSACERISNCATARDRTAAVAAIKKASASTAAVSSQCPAKSANVITKEYFFPSTFCSFYNAYPGTTSPVPGQSVKAVFHACDCILGKIPTSPILHTSRWTSTVRPSTSTSKSSVRTSPKSTLKPAVSSSPLRSSSSRSSGSGQKSSSYKSSSTPKSSNTSKLSTSMSVPSSTLKPSSSPAKSSASRSSMTTKIAPPVTISSRYSTSKSPSRSASSSTKLSTSSRSTSVSSSSLRLQTSSSKVPSSSRSQTSSTTVAPSSRLETSSITSSSSATSTSIVDAYDLISSQGYQAFCSAYLGFTTPFTTITTTQIYVETTVQTNIATKISTSTYTSVSTETDVSTITEYTTITTASPTSISVVVVTKRAVDSMPTLLSGYPDSSLSSACRKAAASPETVVMPNTITITTTQTSHLNITTTAVSVVTELSPTTEQSLATVTSTSTSYTPPLPTQVVVNPSFEIGDFSGSSGQVSPWTYAGSSSTQSNVNNAYQSFDGIRFTVLYLPGTTLSQSLVGLAPGTTYTLQYYYRVYGVSYTAGSAVLTTTIGGQLVDINSIATTATPVFHYVARTATYVATADTATLLFTLTGVRGRNFALDAITLTSTCTECG